MEFNPQIQQYSTSETPLISTACANNFSLSNKNFPQPYSQSNYSMYNNGYTSSPFSHSGSNLSRNLNINSNQNSIQISQGQENLPIPPPTFRQDVWDSLRGFQALISVLYAGTGIVRFGKIFLRMSIKLLKAVCGKSFAFLLKVTGFTFLKQLLKRVLNDGDWLREFAREGTALESVWGAPQTLSKTLSGKILLGLRVISLFGALVLMFLQNREKNKQSQLPEVQMVDPNLGVASFDRTIEDNCKEEEVKLVVLEEESQEQKTTSKKEMTATTEEDSDLNIRTNVAQELMIQEEIQPQIISEDFWKHKNTFEKIQEEKLKKTEFALPSVLQNLKKSTTDGNKPWLSKTKKAPEIRNQINEEKENLTLLSLDAITKIQINAEIQTV